MQGLAALLGLLALAGGGCGTVKSKKSNQFDPRAVDTQVLRFADSFSGQNSVAVDEYANRLNTPEGRIQSRKRGLALDTAVMGIASGPNPMANLLDLVSLATLLRSALEEEAPKAVPPGSLDHWLETSRAQETNAWKLAAAFLTTAQQAELRTAIEQWRAQNPGVRATFFIRPLESTASIRESGKEQKNHVGSVFHLIGLDPVAGLDPAVREVTRTRLFAERALFAFERMPFLLRWQVELLSEELLNREQVTKTVASVDRLSRAVESGTQTAAMLPEHLTEERKAILAALDSQEGKLRDLSAQVGEALKAGERMSSSLDVTVTNFTALMKLLGAGEPSRAPPHTNSRPFNILDYARTADQVGNMAQKLDKLITDASGRAEAPALDRRIASLNAVANRTEADANAVLNHAFLLAAGLLVLAFALAFVYRRLLT